MKIINTKLLDSVTKEAQQNPRLRMNFNIHKSLDSKSQRLLNALEPNTKLPIHRHQHTTETYIVLRGSVRVLFYNQDCEVTQSLMLNPSEGNYGVDIPIGQWHSLEVLESGTVIFEVKDGPYTPLEDKDML